VCTILIGLPKEIKNHADRGGLASASMREFTSHDHQLLVQSGAEQRNNSQGQVTYEAVARDLGYDCVSADSLLA
jgi:alanine dehydrogenase